MKKLNYKVLKPSLSVKRAVIMMHGYGSDNLDMLNLANEFTKLKPDTLFVIPNAPFDSKISTGFQWFPLLIGESEILFNNNEDMINKSIKELEKDSDNKYISTSNLALENLIQTIKTDYNLKSNNIALFGFSQGGIMATYYSMHTETLGCIVCHSGFAYHNKAHQLNTSNKVLLVHGYNDSVVPIKFAFDTTTFFDNHKISYETLFVEYLDHHTNFNTIEASQNFIIKNTK